MVEEASPEFRLRKINETRNYLSDEVKHDIMSEKCQNTCIYSNYVQHLLILVSHVTGSVSVSAIASLVSILVGITRFELGIKIFVITAGIKNYKWIIKKKNKKHDKIVLLGKSKLNTLEVLISKVLIDSYISHGEFVSVNNVLREY